jgi:hypothetical protein
VVRTHLLATITGYNTRSYGFVRRYSPAVSYYICIFDFAVLLPIAARAAEVAVNAVALEAARDGDDPKAEIITLIMAQVAAAVPSKDSLTELKAMSVRQLRGKYLLQASIATLILLDRVMHVCTVPRSASACI